jgi:hypothetical protein
MHILKTAFLWCILISGLTSVVRSETAEHVATANFSKAAIVGAWRLVSIDYSGPNGSLTDPVFGFDPQGIIIYDRSGWMSVHRPVMNRPGTRTSGVVTVDDAKLAAAAFDTYYAYFGTWDYNADTSVITHHLKSSLLPYETGQVYRREVQFDGALLKLIARSQVSGEERQRTLVWMRVSDTGLTAALPGAPLASGEGNSPTARTAAPLTKMETPVPVATKYGDMPTDYQEAIRKYFLGHLRYPDTVEYRDITKPEQGYITRVTGGLLMSEMRDYGWTVKATINAKKSNNSYGGFKTYTFLFRGEKIVDARSPLPSDEMTTPQ